MKKSISSILTLWLVTTTAVAWGTLSAHGQVKSQTIDKIIAHLDPRDGLRITFDLMMDKTPIHGEYYALGENFHYDTPQMKAWYNAKDLWVYLDRNDEVNLSTPMKEDLTEINPLLNLNVIKEQRFRIVESHKNGTYTLTATPERNYKGVIERVVVTADKEYKPLIMTIKEKGVNELIEVRVSALKRGAFPEMKEKGFFGFTGNKLPGKMVIDLR